MRLIDADAIPYTEYDVPYGDGMYDTANVVYESEIDAMPTVDAVPVIRCKDCKHYYYHEMLKQGYCEIPNMQFGEVEPRGYCHRAERKEE